MEIEEYIKTLPEGACRPCGKGRYSLIARTKLGDVSAEQLDVINGVVKEFGLPGIRVTGKQSIQLLDIPVNHLQDVVERLGNIGDTCKYFVQACPGTRACRLGMQDSFAFAAKLRDFLNTFDLPAKLKSGVAGCSMCCAEPFVRDIGLVGTKKGWTVVFGGNAGKTVRKADVLGEGLNEEEAFAVIGKALDFYRENAKKKERTARFVERVGFDAVLEAIHGS
ncbi:nitrite reductase [Pseudodesulfovibrio sp. zrk46]|uniref:nitrite reductase n=1 Tax=Pseudodesulfovibrio sp. zrk46 TaxID=2725288 RepID=UPI001449D032|nr:nitrite reductase [Pseudodesulfovibrio sp. zrk46]QJB57800.1 nitrite reductase [Pseudodesulfovibrio sp. zrk46]